MAVEETQTTNYNIPKYISTDAPNLLDQYNAAMDAIDTELLTVNTAAANAATAAANAGTLANTANTTANAAATQEHVDDLDTTLSNEIATVNANLIAQQVNGEYTKIDTNISPSPENNSLQLFKSTNNSFFFLAGTFRYPAGQVNLIPIPNTTLYGIRIAKIIDSAPQNKIYPYTGFTYETITIGSQTIQSMIGVIANLIIGTDGYLYAAVANNVSTYTYSNRTYYNFMQSKLTLNELNIPVIELELE